MSMQVIKQHQQACTCERRCLTGKTGEIILDVGARVGKARDETTSVSSVVSHCRNPGTIDNTEKVTVISGTTAKAW